MAPLDSNLNFYSSYTNALYPVNTPSGSHFWRISMNLARADSVQTGIYVLGNISTKISVLGERLAYRRGVTRVWRLVEIRDIYSTGNGFRDFIGFRHGLTYPRLEARVSPACECGNIILLGNAKYGVFLIRAQSVGHVEASI